jgi:hypothetical protein
MSERRVFIKGIPWSADEFARVYGSMFSEDQFLTEMEVTFGVDDPERRWKLLDIWRGSIMPVPTYPEGYDIGKGELK